MRQNQQVHALGFEWQGLGFGEHHPRLPVGNAFRRGGFRAHIALERHAVGAQQIHVGQADLPGIIAKHIRDSRVELGPFPGQGVLPRWRLEPFGQFYNRRSFFCHVLFLRISCKP
ncbi:hypothetical protein D3C87_1463250 [compost metagenome]